MADLPQYTGVTYDSAYSRNPEESMYDYMMRLASQRASGVLGGGGMLDTPAEEITSAPLGEVKQNCPAGYVLRNGACVPVSSGGNYEEDMPEPTMEERYTGARMLLDNPALASAARAVIPLGLGHVFLRDDQIEGYVRNAQNEATGSQGFLDYLMGNDGDVVLGDQGTGIGSLVTGQESNITRGMFPEIFDPMNFTNQMGVVGTQTYPVNVNPTAGLLTGAITTGPDAINPTSDNWSVVDSPSSPTGLVSVYTPSSWSESDITSTPSTSSSTPDWYSAATGESWD